MVSTCIYITVATNLFYADNCAQRVCKFHDHCEAKVIAKLQQGYRFLDHPVYNVDLRVTVQPTKYI